MRVMDTRMRVLFDMSMAADSFVSYTYNSDKEIVVGFNTVHFYKMLKNIQKKDTFEIRIESEDSPMCEMFVYPKDGNRMTRSVVKILTWQVVDIEIPTGYSRPVIVTTSEIQKAVKDLDILTDKIVVRYKNNVLLFSSSVDKVYSKTIQFGEHEYQSNIDMDTDYEFEDEFENMQFSSITKITGLNKEVKVFVKKNNPIMLTIILGSLGTLDIYLNSASNIQS